jgi:hypothetical protein
MSNDYEDSIPAIAETWTVTAPDGTVVWASAEPGVRNNAGFAETMAAHINGCVLHALYTLADVRKDADHRPRAAVLAERNKRDDWRSQLQSELDDARNALNGPSTGAATENALDSLISRLDEFLRAGGL